ncbi:MAG: hypothetical protein GY950_07185 [bacterium]|nr:hypothetical protein [bacterium]
MSSKEDYDAKLDAIQAIEDSQITPPLSIPVDVYLQETENLYDWCMEDIDTLTAKGLNADLVTDLPVRAGALRRSESRWNLQRFSKEEAAKKWAEDSPAAYDLRNVLIHEFRFAFRDDKDLTKKVKQVANGYGHADMIQDLSDLSVLGKEHPDLLTAIGFDLLLLDEADAKADELSALYAVVIGDRASYNASKKIRDQAHTYLKTIVDDIHRFGQHAFWRDDERKTGYRSNFLHRKRAQKPVSSPPETSEGGEEVNS